MSEVTNTSVKAPRNANVSDEAIIKAWETAAITKVGTASSVAASLGMKKASLVQRVQSLKNIGIKLGKLTREPSVGGGGKKKDVASVQAMLEKVRLELQTNNATSSITTPA